MIYLFENATGFTLFKKQDSKVKKINSYDFKNNDELLETYTLLNKNKLPKNLEIFISSEFAKLDEVLCVRDNKLQSLLSEKCGISVQFDKEGDFKQIKNELDKFVDDENKIKTLFLSHKLALDKISYNTDKLDAMIIQSINLLIDIDKDINLHCMRLREWYGSHFPELSLIIDDNYQYLKVVSEIKNRNTCTLEKLKNVTGEQAEKIFKLAKNSMGTDLSDEDLINIINDCASVIKNFEYRTNLSNYIKEKMVVVAPNLTNLIGEFMGARLLSKAGSLDTLAKYPSSTVQLLGAEKSLFQSLRNKSNTPKYGLIFESSILGQVAPEYKGKVARSLAAKISLCAKLDASPNNQSGSFGLDSKNKLMNRIKNLENRSKPKKSVTVKSKFLIKNSEKYDDKNDVKRSKKN
ncbi:nucleolar protein 58 (NOP58) [Vairimorpha necatrix]|uniref:Nucleolar protein 58 (NOP58) n=1 Tax=Vairimorpha necatrix TaxID=6039 RepID=A0AAX4JBN9_9MICR